MEIFCQSAKNDRRERTRRIGLVISAAMQRQRHVDLSGVGMTLSGWEFAEERARVRAGTLTELGRLILWSPKKGKLEPSHFSVVPFKNLKHPPPDIEARTKLSLKARMAVRTLYYKPPAVREWKSAVFIRCEKGNWPTTDLLPTTFDTQPLLEFINNGLLFTGVTQREAEEALVRVEYWYEYYLQYDFTPAEAYYKVVLRFPDAFFDCYTFPKASFTF